MSGTQASLGNLDENGEYVPRMFGELLSDGTVHFYTPDAVTVTHITLHTAEHGPLSQPIEFPIRKLRDDENF